VVAAVGSLEATRESIATVRNHLEASCCIVVGGVREMFLQGEWAVVAV
jgi:transcription elongation factor